MMHLNFCAVKKWHTTIIGGLAAAAAAQLEWNEKEPLERGHHWGIGQKEKETNTDNFR